MTTVHSGDLVQIEYTTRSLEGGVIETSARRGTLEFRAGQGDVLAGLSRGVIGLRVGEKATLSLPAEQAFGRRRPELEQTIPADDLPDGVQPGDQLAATVDGVVLDAWLLRRQGKDAVIDLNHPLAGETLVVDVQVLGVRPGESRA